MAALQGWTVIAVTSINLFRSSLGFKYFQRFVIPFKQGKLPNPFLEASIIILSENNNNNNINKKVLKAEHCSSHHMTELVLTADTGKNVNTMAVLDALL